MRFYVAIAILLMLANMISVFSLIFIERKDPTTTWAWLLILMLVPGIGFIIYLLLGQNLSRQKIFREKKIIDKTRAAGLEEMQEIRGIVFFYGKRSRGVRLPCQYGGQRSGDCRKSVCLQTDFGTVYFRYL